MHYLQIIIPFFIAGIGICFAGIILDHVQYWEVFTAVDELYLVLPALLGLKGNLQMTLASRLSTHSHLGHIQTKEDLLSLSCANLSLNQCFAIVMSLLSSFLASIIHLTTTDSPFDVKNLLLITATALLTSSVTSFLLDILMILVVQGSAAYKINPDNVATPIAAALGDITALVTCAWLGHSFYKLSDHPLFYWLTSLVILFYLFLVPIWAGVAQENVHTIHILEKSSHWYPIITAMVISSISGVILSHAINKSDDIALYQPIICGVGGNLVAVQASGLATSLHRNQKLGELPKGESICMDPFKMLCSTSPTFRITRILMAIVIPGQIVFYYFCMLVNSQTTDSSWLFLGMYLLGSQILVIILLYLAYVLTYALWVAEVDPDNCTIPYLTSISDVIGACIITIICLIALPGRATEVKSGLEN